MAMISADNRGLRLATRYAVLGLIAVIFIFPLVFMLMSSFKPDQQLLQDASNLRAFLPVGAGALFDLDKNFTGRRIEGVFNQLLDD